MASAKALRAVWSYVLDIDEEEIEDTSHYAELGGDSVMALKLVETAPSYGIELDVETVFTEPTFNRMLAKTKQRRDPDPDPDSGQNSSASTNTGLIQTCAEACSLSVDQIEDVFSEAFFPAGFFLMHQEGGAWLSQIVFELSSGLDVATACRAFETIHARNHAFRSRFVCVNKQVYNVVTTSPATWQYASSLEDYKANDLVTKVFPGQPAVRYGLVQEFGKTYIVWTALHSVQDGWTRKLLCDDLEAFLNDQDEFLARPSRPSYKSYVDHVKRMDIDASKAIWEQYLAGLGQQRLPTHALNQAEKPAINKEIRKHIPKQKPQDSDIRLSIVAHAALGVVLGSLTHCRDIAYPSVRGSRTLFPGAEAVMGALMCSVPVRIQINPSETVRDLVSKVNDDAISMMRHEPVGVEAAIKAQVDPFNGIEFNWYPRGMGLLSRNMQHSGKQRQNELVKVIEEQSAPYAQPSILNVHEDRNLLTVELDYDNRVFSDEFMERLAQGFVDLLLKMCNCDPTIQVQSLLDSVREFEDGK